MIRSAQRGPSGRSIGSAGCFVARASSTLTKRTAPAGTLGGPAFTRRVTSAAGRITTAFPCGSSRAIAATVTGRPETNVPAAPMFTRPSFFASAAVENTLRPPTFAARRKTTLAAELAILRVLHERVVDHLGDIEALDRGVRLGELVAAVLPCRGRDLRVDRE